MKLYNYMIDTIRIYKFKYFKFECSIFTEAIIIAYIKVHTISTSAEIINIHNIAVNYYDKNP